LCQRFDQLGALFPLDEIRRREGKKKEKRKEKNHHGEGRCLGWTTSTENREKY
jgi:hypothetical protein